MEVASVRRSRIARLWCGDYSLARAFWLFGFVLIGVLGAWTIGVVTLIEVFDYEPLVLFLGAVAIWGGVLAVTVLHGVGVWRSALRHLRENRSRVGAVLAFSVVGLGFLSLVSEVHRAMVPQLVEIWAIAFHGDPDIADFSLTLSQDARVVVVRGGIKFGLARELSRTLAENPDLRVLAIRSDGGRVQEGLRLAEIVRSHGLDTLALDVCASACADVFLAGRERLAERHTRIGFHQPSFSGESQFDRSQASRALEERLLEAGVAPALAARAARTPHERMFYPTRDELLEGRVVTRLVSSSERDAILGPDPERASREDGKRAIEVPLLVR